MNLEAEVRELSDRLNGLSAVMEGGFRELKGEMKYQDKLAAAWRVMFVGPLILALVALLLAGFATSVATTNKALIVELVKQSNMQERLLRQGDVRLERLEGNPGSQAGP